ncbi:hypothetical protein KM043_002116 [Ampulex compressa]|nr:hypothetical protein KM043_002116 [Ampulex compressa]
MAAKLSKEDPPSRIEDRLEAHEFGESARVRPEVFFDLSSACARGDNECDTSSTSFLELHNISIVADKSIVECIINVSPHWKVRRLTFGEAEETKPTTTSGRYVSGRQ